MVNSEREMAYRCVRTTCCDGVLELGTIAQSADILFRGQRRDQVRGHTDAVVHGPLMDLKSA
jgi:hypothetical protein